MPLLNKSDTTENVAVFLREDNDYIDFVFSTRQNTALDVCTRIPIMSAAMGIV